MKSEPLISVVIAAYNASKFIVEAIESVLNQSYKNLEIIVVDDGSTDDTQQVLLQYKDNCKLRCFFQVNQGQAKAKNKGIVEAKGSFIAFLDADDKWTADKLEYQLPFFYNSNRIGVVFTNIAHINEQGKLIPTPHRIFYSGRLTEKLLKENVITGMSSIVKKECFDKVGIFDEQLPMGIDYDLWLRISVYYEFFYLEKVTYLYRQWAGQMSHNHRGRYENGIRIMKKFLENNPNLLGKDIINEAWAHTFVGQGNTIFEKEKKRKEAFIHYMRALKHKFSYLPAWKSIIKLAITLNISGI